MTATPVEKTAHIVDSIITCAARRFKQYGYKKTTVGEITADLHISKKTLYDVFPSKSEILKETAWREMTEVIAIFSESVAKRLPSDKLMIALCKFIFVDRIKRGTEGLFWGLYSEDTYVSTAYSYSLKRVFTAIYTDGRRRGLLKPANDHFSSEIIVNVVLTTTDYFHRSDNPVRMFDTPLRMIADMVAFQERIVFDAMG